MSIPPIWPAWLTDFNTWWMIIAIGSIALNVWLFAKYHRLSGAHAQQTAASIAPADPIAKLAQQQSIPVLSVDEELQHLGRNMVPDSWLSKERTEQSYSELAELAERAAAKLKERAK